MLEFFDMLEKDPEIQRALLNPIFIDNSIENLQKVNEAMIKPLLICDNPDIELPPIKTQLNFLVPQVIRKSKEPYVINLKNDLNMYRKLYEKHSKQVNQIIEKTKESIKNLYQPLKQLADDIKKNSTSFESIIIETSTPLKNKKNSLIQINPQKYSKEKQKEFKKDKDKIIEEINNYLREAQTFYEKYEKINKNTLSEIEGFVKTFMDLAKPAQELTTFMRKFFKVFENSATEFNNIKDKKRIDEALKKIKEPVNEICTKAENIKQMLKSVDNIKKEELENMTGIIQENKRIMETLKAKSTDISTKITEIRKKYGEKEEDLKTMNIVESEPLNMSDYEQKVAMERKGIDKETENKLNNLEKDAISIIQQSRLDLLFIMDITNSMDTFLDQAKSGILDMIKEIQKQCPGIEIYLGFIGYRDFNDLDFDDAYINLEFTKDYESIKNNIAFVKAEGGGDIAEDLCGAFVLAKNKDWVGKSRFAILVTDSPCHGKKYHDLKDEDDNYPEGDREQRNIEDFIKFFAQNEISLYCLKINSTTDKMFKIFKEIYESSKNKDSKNNFVVGQGKKIFNIVT